MGFQKEMLIFNNSYNKTNNNYKLYKHIYIIDQMLIRRILFLKETGLKESSPKFKNPKNKKEKKHLYKKV